MGQLSGDDFVKSGTSNWPAPDTGTVTTSLTLVEQNVQASPSLFNVEQDFAASTNQSVVAIRLGCRWPQKYE